MSTLSISTLESIELKVKELKQLILKDKEYNVITTNNRVNLKLINLEEEYDLNDFFLKRFIIGFNYDVIKAKEMYDYSFKIFRKKYNCFEIRQELKLNKTNKNYQERINKLMDLTRLKHFDKISKVYPERYFHGLDKTDTHPIMITMQEMIQNLTGLLTILTKRQYIEFRIYRFINRELLLHEISIEKNKLSQMIIIWDLLTMTTEHFDRLKLKTTAKFFSSFDEEATNAFPEVVYKIIGINTPTFLSILYSVIKRMLPKRTLNKIIITNSDKKRIIESLTSIISIDNIPIALHGNCNTKKTVGWFNSEIYGTFTVEKRLKLKSNTILKEEEEEEMEINSTNYTMYGKLVIKAGRKEYKEFSFDPTLGNCKYGFQLKSADIVINVNIDGEAKIKNRLIKADDFYVANSTASSNNSSELSSSSTKKIESLSSTNDKKMTIQLEFDNTASYFRSKTVYYSFVIL